MHIDGNEELDLTADLFTDFVAYHAGPFFGRDPADIDRRLDPESFELISVGAFAGRWLVRAEG